MPFGIDIQEDEILSWGHGILDALLHDRTTGENIIWATDDYASMGEAYTFSQHWLCNDMNNGIDERWFKRKPVFNIVTTEKGKNRWTPTTKKVTSYILYNDDQI